MKKTLLTAALILTAAPVWASGWRIPEQSLNSIALSNAYVAHTTGADGPETRCEISCRISSRVRR